MDIHSARVSLFVAKKKLHEGSAAEATKAIDGALISLGGLNPSSLEQLTLADAYSVERATRPDYLRRSIG